jgi:hypothetical protein
MIELLAALLEQYFLRLLQLDVPYLLYRKES